jgi:hypothetical protein
MFWRLAVVVFVGLAACLWRSYVEIMEVHLEVLSAMVDKAADTSASGTRPTAQAVTELRYPLLRARQFLSQYEEHRGRRSYSEFEALVEVYQDMVNRIDGARGDEVRWRQLAGELGPLAAEVREAVGRVREALGSER